MTNPPASRPDVERIKARLKATQDEGGATEGITVDPELWHDAEALIAHIEALEIRQEKLEAVVGKQAADESLWRVADSNTEAYFQQELRKLHEIIEGKTSEECALAALGDGDG